MVLLTRPTMLAAMMSPMSAIPIGRPIAMMEPNARTRMTIAARIPRASLSGNAKTSKIAPPYAMVTSLCCTNEVVDLICFPITSISSCVPRATLSCANATVRS